MPASQRSADTGVIAELLEQPHSFEFFQAVRLLAQARLPQPCYRNRLSLAFPPNQIENIGEESDGRIRLTPAFIGMLGSQGVLPLHYSECVNRHEKSHNDGGPRAFLDLLSHRATELFYQAWAKHRPEAMDGPDDEDDSFLTMLLALAGVPECEGVQPETLARYAMQIRSRSVSAPQMAGMYAEYFDVPFAVQQLVGQWQPLAPEHQAQLAHANVDLGSGVLLGERIYGCDARVRLRIGPLPESAYERFLPGGANALQLAAMLGLHCGAGMIWEVFLVREGSAMRAPRLDGTSRLSVDAFLVDDEVGHIAQADREELMYLLHT
ncbi:type VI secretion system protein ImpH [Duganella sp. 3397]|uniref:type VI secretion system baseplate subunit TssG n=1 Tax=Duganella sp. 3397 TaxID=2817732 RepID=UPI0028645E15|nr:type VI secretion system baseplate subunit TssG [Duganella sp. 3397]MDR7047595.1 type VI secretion system protein ImpH [Duganella sp. 3397]